ncbi:MAG: hypothetical protein LR015_06245 [Verrucomicrobia bacterium]|nr:hypothetical protein [Verrucomicrobiota bacterium]
MVDEYGQEMVTPESSLLIDKTQARYMGLLAGADIKALRENLKMTQDQFSDLIGCGKKSLSRWKMVMSIQPIGNTLLRLLDEGVVEVHDLLAVKQPRHKEFDEVTHFLHARKDAPRTYNLKAAWENGCVPMPEPIAQ